MRTTLEKCPDCGGKLVEAKHGHTSRIAGHTFTATLPVDRCETGGHWFVADRDLAAYEAAVASRLVEGNVTRPDALRFLRGVLGLKGAELADLLHLRRETISRWEQGKRPIDGTVYAVLRQMILDLAQGSTATIDFLRTRGKRKLPRTIHVEQPPVE